jgi:hypothetical protein
MCTTQVEARKSRDISMAHDNRWEQKSAIECRPSKFDSQDDEPALRSMLREWRHALCFTNSKPDLLLEASSRSKHNCKSAHEDTARRSRTALSDDWPLASETMGRDWEALVLTLKRDGQYVLRVKSRSREARKPAWDPSKVDRSTHPSQSSRPGLRSLARAYSRHSQVEPAQLEWSGSAALDGQHVSSSRAGNLHLASFKSEPRKGRPSTFWRSSFRPRPDSSAESSKCGGEPIRKPRKKWENASRTVEHVVAVDSWAKRDSTFNTRGRSASSSENESGSEGNAACASVAQGEVRSKWESSDKIIKADPREAMELLPSYMVRFLHWSASG